MKPQFTLSVFTENHIGLLHRVTSVFTKRKINIESLTVSQSEIPGIHRFTIVVTTTAEQAARLVTQLEKQVEVLKALVHQDEELIFQELAMYKISAGVMLGPTFEELLRRSGARILAVDPQFVVIEKTGHRDETEKLLVSLAPYGVLEFVRSGRVAMARPMKELSEFLRELDEARSFS